MAKSKFAGLRPDLGADNEKEAAIETVAEPTPEPTKTTRKTTRAKSSSNTSNTKPSATTAKPQEFSSPEPASPPRKVTRRGNSDYIAVTRYLDRRIMLRLNSVEDRLRLSKNLDINQSELIDEILAAWLGMWEGQDPIDCFERSKQRIDRYPDLN
jgi:hypothetical protein